MRREHSDALDTQSHGVVLKGMGLRGRMEFGRHGPLEESERHLDGGRSVRDSPTRDGFVKTKRPGSLLDGRECGGAKTAVAVAAIAATGNGRAERSRYLGHDPARHA
jgi:hypothetical protein